MTVEQVRIAVLDINDNAVAFLDNEAPDALHYYDEELHVYLQGAANTFIFTCSAQHEDAAYLTVGNHLSFRYKGKGYYFNIMTVEDTEYTVDVEAFGLVFELIGEEKDAYTATKAMTFAQYMAVFDSPGAVHIGVNEISGRTRTLEWTSSDTMLSRLYSLATNFDAEIEFVSELDNNYSLKQITMNVYREHSGTDQGIGADRTGEVIRYGKGITGITRTSDTTELYTAIRPYGTDNLTITGLSKTEKDVDGNVEYQTSGNNILAVQAKDRFPAMLFADTTDRYVVKIWSYDTKDRNVLYSKALAKLKEICVPQVSYDVEGYIDAGIGDTLTIADEAFSPALYLSARVTEQVISFTKPENCKTTFDNFTELTSQIDESLISEVQKLVEQNKVYTCTAVSSNGTVFRNADDSTTLTARVLDNGVDVTDDFTIVWSRDGTAQDAGKTLTVAAADITSTSCCGYTATDAAGTVRGSYEVTLLNVTDVAKGEDAILLYIDSSNGDSFKNSSIATTLTVTIYTGGAAINSSAQLAEAFGAGVYLQWRCKQMGETSWTTLDSGDSRLSDNGFILTLQTSDVNEKAIFDCNLMDQEE